jgi:hypothetical protein
MMVTAIAELRRAFRSRSPSDEARDDGKVVIRMGATRGWLENRFAQQQASGATCWNNPPACRFSSRFSEAKLSAHRFRFRPVGKA